MNSRKLNNLLRQTTDELSASNSLHGLFHEHRDGDPLPSGPVLAEIIDLCRAIIFPGFYGNSTLSYETLPYHIGVNLERLYSLLCEQILAGLCFGCSGNGCLEKAQDIATTFISHLPQLRAILATDVEAAYNGDPAAESYSEIISCYPIIKAITNYRIAH